MNAEELSYLLIKRKGGGGGSGDGEVVTDNDDAELLQAVPKEYKQSNTL